LTLFKQILSKKNLDHVLAENGVIIGDDPELDLNSHGLSEGSMADKLQPACPGAGHVTPTASGFANR
jgi:hypothetical protein